MMKRRSALKTISLGFGYTITLGGISTMAVACKGGSASDKVNAWAPSFLSSEDSDILDNILDAFLPKTDNSPGFKDIGGLQLVDALLSKVYKAEDQDRFKSGFAQIVKLVKEGGDDGVANFMKTYMGETAKSKMMEVQKKFMDVEDETLSTAMLKQKHFYDTISSIRYLGISTYFANQTIATEHLSYDPIPGGYNGCIPVEDVGNTWSL